MPVTYTLPTTAGTGTELFEERILDPARKPLAGVKCVITTDATHNSTEIAWNTSRTDGTIRLMLNPGIYWMWCALPGYRFTNPTRIEVTQ